MNTTQPTSSASPARPNLFAPLGQGDKPAPQRISVLASLDPKPLTPQRSRRRPLMLALAGLCSIGILAAASEYLAQHRPGQTPGTIAHPDPAAHTAASAPQADPRLLATPEQASSAPASVETLATEAPAQTAANAIIQTEPAAAASPASAPSEAEATPKHPQKSLLTTLAAPQEKPARDDAHKTSKALDKKKITTSNEASLDTDVILLEALVAHNKSRETKLPTKDGRP
jgi:hypothetical protein